MESSSTAHVGGTVLGVAFTDGAQNVLSGLCTQQRAQPGHIQEVLQASLAISPSFSRGPAASTGFLALLIASSPDVSPTSDEVRPDGPRALYILPGLRPLPSPTQDGPAQSLPWCGHKVSCCSWAPWLTFSAPSLRLERPGRMPAGSSPPLQGSGQSLVRVLAEFPANPWSDGLRSPVGKPQCVGQYSIDCPHPLIGQCRLVSE